MRPSFQFSPNRLPTVQTNNWQTSQETEEMEPGKEASAGENLGGLETSESAGWPVG